MVGKLRSWTNYDITETSLISWKLKQKVKETPKAMWLLRTKIKAQTCFLWSYILWPFIISVSALALNTTWFITLWSINFLWAREESAKTAEMQPPTNLLNMFIFLKIISSGNLCYKTNPVGQISPTMNFRKCFQAILSPPHGMLKCSTACGPDWLRLASEFHHWGKGIPERGRELAEDNLIKFGENSFLHPLGNLIFIF